MVKRILNIAMEMDSEEALGKLLAKILVDFEGSMTLSTTDERVVDNRGRRKDEPILSKKEWNEEVGKRTQRSMDRLKNDMKVFTGSIFGWDANLNTQQLVPNWKEQDVIDYMRFRHYKQGASGNQIAKDLNEQGTKGKNGGKWTSAMVLRTLRYQFNEKRNKEEYLKSRAKWWGKKPWHDAVPW